MAHHHHVFGGYRGRTPWLNPDAIEVTEEMRATAFARANETLGKLDELRKRRELPVEMLPLVAMEYGAALQSLIDTEARKAEAAEVAKYEAEIAQRYPRHSGHNFMPGPLDGAQLGALQGAWGDIMRRQASPVGERDELKFKSERPIRAFDESPGERRFAFLIERPRAVAFRPEEMHIIGNAAHWVIDDVLIGNRSQFAQSGPIPGDMFDVSAIDSFISFETCQTAMDIEIRFRYVGPDPEGEIFEVKMVGVVAR